MMLEDPNYVGMTIRILREQLARARRVPVQDLTPGAMWQHMEATVPFGNARLLTYMGFLGATMWEAAERQEHEKLHMLTGLMCLFVEQTAVEGGSSYNLGWALTGLEEPPFATTELRKPKSLTNQLTSGLHPHAALAEPGWLVMNLAYLADWEAVAKKTENTHRKKTKGAGKDKEE